jgi:hypothetical protein
MINSSMPGLVKVGFTQGTSEKRAKALRTTGVPTPFIVLYEEYVSDIDLVERLAHEILVQHRVDPRREFFRSSPKLVINSLIKAADGFRIGPTDVGGNVEILDRLKEKYGDIFRDDLISAQILVTSDGVLLREDFFDDLRERRSTVEFSLGFISNGEEPIFQVGDSAVDNADRFIELDPLSLIMCTDLVRESDALRISREVQGDLPS